MPYFMVSVRETIEATYPVAADDECSARMKAVELVASGKVDPPSRASGGRRCAPEAATCTPSEESACVGLASRAFGIDQVPSLLGADAPLDAAAPTPPSIARSAKAVLERTGSGELHKSQRRRG